MKESLLVAYGFTDLFFPIRKRDLSPLIHQSEYSMYKIFCYYSKEKPSVQTLIITKSCLHGGGGPQVGEINNRNRK